MKNKNVVEVLIDGKKYSINGFESDDYIQKVVSYLNKKIKEYKKVESYKRLDSDLKNLFLNINLVDDYFKAKDKIELLNEENKAKDKMVLEMKNDMIEFREIDNKRLKKISELEKKLEEANKKLDNLEKKNKK